MRNEDGAAAVEFALVAVPFLLFVLGLLGMGLYFLADTSLENGVEGAARKLRTGEAEKGNMTVGSFRELVCQEAGSYIDCGKVSTIVQHAATWSEITPQSCTDASGNMTGSTGSIPNSSTSTRERQRSRPRHRLLQVGAGPGIPFLQLGSGDGSGPAIIQAATAFKSEPYK